MKLGLTSWGLAGVASAVATAANAALAWLFRGSTYSDVAFSMAILSGMALLLLAACPDAWRAGGTVSRPAN